MAGVFGPHSLIRSLIAKAPTSIEVLAPKVITNPNFPDQTTIDWAQATVEDTVPGDLQPLGENAAERLGLTGVEGYQQLFLSRSPLVPMQRVRVAGETAQHSVEELRAWRSHVEAVVKAVAS